MVTLVLALAPALPAVAQEPAASDLAADSLAPDFALRRAGAVLRWHVITRELVGRQLARRSGGQPATFYDGNNNTRLYALVAGAQYDALRRARPPLADAASSAAAAAVLQAIFPQDSSYLDAAAVAERDRLLEAGASSGAIADAGRAGRRAAGRWVRRARAEERTPQWSGEPPSGPEYWRGENGPPSLAISIELRPWFLKSARQFRPPPPPAVGSAAFRAALAEVRTATAGRTRPETRASWAWARNAATLWSEIAGDLIIREHLSELQAARALMYLNMALSDATIACWDAKLTYWYPRPSQADPALDLSVPLPNFPSYPSAHATLFAAGSAVLGQLVPTERVRLDSLAREATMSRLWAGVHYPFDNEAGVRLGRDVARLALAALDADERVR